MASQDTVETLITSLTDSFAATYRPNAGDVHEAAVFSAMVCAGCSGARTFHYDNRTDKDVPTLSSPSVPLNTTLRTCT
jgi:hypothetical protein